MPYRLPVAAKPQRQSARQQAPMTQPTTVYLLLMDMVKHEQNFGAYRIYLALTKGYRKSTIPSKALTMCPLPMPNSRSSGAWSNRTCSASTALSSTPHRQRNSIAMTKKSRPSTLPKTPLLHKSYTSSISVTSP